MTIVWILGSILVLVVAPVSLMLCKTMPIAWNVYREQLVRESPDKWKRENSCPSDAEYSSMYQAAEDWAERYSAETKEVSIQSDGLKLCGRFTDFDSDRTAVILCGRAEGCVYSYYYAEPYREEGFNILVIDQRAHGNSEGIYSGMGFLEQNDVIAWIRYLQEECHTKEVVIHGVCIGAACAVYVAANPDCPESVKGIVVDGLFRSFHDVFIARFRTYRKPLFPVLWEVEYLIRKNTGIDIRTDAPFRAIKSVRIPILLIHSKEDVSSLPEKVLPMAESCPARTKIVWAEHGAHSHVRYRNTALYDTAVKDFLDSIDEDPENELPE